MSSEKDREGETAALLVNGVSGRESPAVGVSGNKPLVNGDLGDNASEGELIGGRKTTLEGNSDTIQGDMTGKTSSSSAVSLIVSSGPKINVASTASNKPRSFSTYHNKQPHRLPTAVNYYRYVPLASQPTPIFYPTQPQTYLSTGSLTGGGGSQLSGTNLYIRGLQERCSDEDLIKMCQQYGKIVSTKAILDKQTNYCKGYGFVDFENPGDALKAVQGLQSAGVMAQFAKVPQQQEQDPTNLYFSNLPKTYDEKELESLVAPYGTIVSTRVLRDPTAVTSRGVGFVRLDNKESCDKTIEMLNGTTLPDSNEPLMVKFADSSSNKKRQHAAGRWRDIGDYVYDTTPMIAQNGLVSSRLLHQGMVASPYVQTGHTHHMSGYQVPASQALSTGAWQPTYYMQPSTQTALAAAAAAATGSSGVVGGGNGNGGGGSSNDTSQITAHLNHLHISTTSPYTPATGTHHQQQHTAYATPQGAAGASYQIPQPTAATQYTQHTPGGWTFSHHPTTHHHLVTQQDHINEVVHSTGGGGGNDGKGHIQMITAADHTSSLGKDDHQQQRSVHLYYPTNNWVGK